MTRTACFPVNPGTKRNPRWRAAALATIALLVALATTACQPAPTYPTNRVTFEGDSIMIQAGLYSDPSDGRFATGANGDLVNVAGGHMSAGVGWTTGMAQFDAIADGRQLPQILVIATAHNDASIDFTGGPRDGWTWADRNTYAANVRTVPAEACVVVMLPGVGEGVSAAHRTEIGKARRSIQAIAAENPGTVVVDFQATIDEYAARGEPIIVTSDGIHKGPNGPRSARAYIDTLWSGLEQCP